MTHSVWVLGRGPNVRVSGGRDRRMAAVAGLQRGRIARFQLVAIQVSDTVVAGLTARGSLHRRRRGIYAVGHAGEVPLGRETVALLAVGADGLCALGHRSAALIWGIPLPRGGARRPVDVTVSRDVRHRPAGIAVHRSRIITPGDICLRQGLPVVSPALVLLQLAAELGGLALEAAFDHALVHKLVRPADVQRLLDRAGGHTGAAHLRALARRETTPALTRSDGERALRRLLRDAGLPQPQSNAMVHGWEVDLYWPEHGLVVELDGFDFHSTRRQVERDRLKDQVLRAHGMPPLRITGGQLSGRPLAVLAIIAQALAGVA